MKYENILFELRHEQLVRNKFNHISDLLERIVKGFERDLESSIGVKVERWDENFPKLDIPVKGVEFFKSWSSGIHYRATIKVKCSGYFFKRKFCFKSRRRKTITDGCIFMRDTRIGIKESLILKPSDFDAIIDELQGFINQHRNW